MKYLLFIVSISFLLSACDSGGNNDDKTQSLKELDFSGTWKSSIETKRIKKSTGEYLSSTFFENTVLMDDTDNGVLFSECQNYGVWDSYAIKTDKHFYTDPALDGFKLQSNGSLQQISRQEYDYSPDFVFESINTLKKISDSIDLDNGTLVLNGPISVEEYAHVCFWQNTSDIGVNRNIELSVRYGSSYLSMRLDIEGDIVPGVYQYDDRYSYRPDSSVFLNVSSNAPEFDDIVGSNTLSAYNVTVTISVATDDRVLGSFEFTGQDNGVYSGEFEILF